MLREYLTPLHIMVPGIMAVKKQILNLRGKLSHMPMDESSLVVGISAFETGAVSRASLVRNSESRGY